MNELRSGLHIVLSPPEAVEQFWQVARSALEMEGKLTIELRTRLQQNPAIGCNRYYLPATEFAVKAYFTVRISQSAGRIQRNSSTDWAIWPSVK